LRFSLTTLYDNERPWPARSICDKCSNCAFGQRKNGRKEREKARIRKREREKEYEKERERKIMRKERERENKKREREKHELLHWRRKRRKNNILSNATAICYAFSALSLHFETPFCRR
jgi:hypothetical protein